MSCALVKKLGAFVDLTGAEVSALEKAASRPRRLEARADVIREGDVPTDVHLVTSGLACRYKLLADGRRQIVAYLIPGDFCDFNVFILARMDHSIAAISAVQMVWLPFDR